MCATCVLYFKILLLRPKHLITADTMYAFLNDNCLQNETLPYFLRELKVKIFLLFCEEATLSTVTIIFTKNTCSAFYSRKQLGEGKRWGEKNKQISCFVPSPLFCFFTRNISYLSLWCHFQQHHRTRLFVIY